MLLNSGVNKHAVMMQEHVSDIMPGWRMPEKQDVWLDSRMSEQQDVRTIDV